MKPVSKLPQVGTTIFTVMSKMAADYDAINLSQGFPDFEVPEGLRERLQHYIDAGLNQYPPMQGVPYLREQIAAKVLRCYDISVDVEHEITVTSGATEALFVAIQTLVTAGDEVIIFDPAYDSYEPAINLAGGRAIHLPLSGEDFSINFDDVRAAITPRTRAIILNSPHNPTGAILGPEDLEQLAAITRDTSIYLISDEVYEHMVFDGVPHQSLLLNPELRARSYVISSFGKTYHATGWKVGYAIAPETMTSEFRKIHQYVTFTTHTPTQWALADYLEHHPEHDQELAGFYQKKRDVFLSAMSESGFSMMPTPGTYFQLADYSQLSSLPDDEFATLLTREAGVAAIPVSGFYDAPPEQRIVRFCFAKQDETLVLAAEKLTRHFS